MRNVDKIEQIKLWVQCGDESAGTHITSLLYIIIIQLTARKSFNIILLIFRMLPQLMQYNPWRAVVLPKRQEPMNIL